MALGHFQEIIEKSYSLAPGAGPYVITENMLKLPEVELLVGYADGCHTCTSMLVKTGPVAGIYWVGTLAEFRYRGLGKPVYERIGFANPYNYRNFNSPAVTPQH